MKDMAKNNIITVSELVKGYKTNNPEGHYFDKQTMDFFGDTFGNFLIKDGSDTWDLFRKNDVIPNPPGDDILQKAGYVTSFSKSTFEELNNIKNNLYHITTGDERTQTIYQQNNEKSENNGITINNPDNLKYDILIYENKDRYFSIYIDNQLPYQYPLRDLNKVHDLIKNNYPGREIVIQEYDDKLRPYILYSGYEISVKDENDNHFINKLNNYFSNSLLNNTSILLKNRKGIDYSVDAITNKPYNSIQQFYLQQIRSDNSFKSPYFSSSDKQLLHPFKKDTKGSIIANYDKRANTLNYEFVYNFDLQYANIETKKQSALIKTQTIDKPQINEKDELAKRINNELQYNIAQYFNSIYSGSPFKPTPQLINDKNIIAQYIKDKKVMLTQIINNAYKVVLPNVQNNNSRTITNNNKLKGLKR